MHIEHAVFGWDHTLRTQYLDIALEVNKGAAAAQPWNPETGSRAAELRGFFRDHATTLCEELGFRRFQFHVPLAFVPPLIEVASNWRLPAPINSDQLAMLLEESVVHGESNDLLDVFGVEPKPLRAVIRELGT